MRFYSLILTDPATGKTATRQDGSPFAWGTNINGSYDPGALDIEFDVQVSAYDQPIGGHGITLYGVAIEDLLQANQFAGTAPGNGMIATLSGGMTAGLPLANPKQAGIIAQGRVVQSFGNWVNTEQTVDFVLNPSSYTPDNPGNIVINWKANSPLSQALSNCLSVAYPGVPQNIQISPELKLTHDEVGFYPSLEALAQAITNITQFMLGDDYDGVSIAYQGGQLYVYDGTVTPAAQPIQIQFQDLVGQPTWIGQNLMQFVTVLRSDIKLSSIVKMPVGLQSSPGAVTTTAQSAPNGQKYKTTFQGQFTIKQVRHLGRLRAPDGQSWITVFNCSPYGGPAPASPTN